MNARRTSPRSPARMKYADHQRLWRIIEGAVVDALTSHPDYLTDKGQLSAVGSITKRVIGNLIGAAQTRKGGRLGGCSGPPVTSGERLLTKGGEATADPLQRRDRPAAGGADNVSSRAAGAGEDRTNGERA